MKVKSLVIVDNNATVND